MGKEGYISHEFPLYNSLTDRISKTNLFFTYIAENVAFSETVAGELIHKELMNSQFHKKNILNKKFTHCGVKMFETEKGFYLTQSFIKIIHPPIIGSLKKKLYNKIGNAIKEKNGYKPEILESYKTKVQENANSLLVDDLLKYKLRSFNHYQLISHDINIININILNIINKYIINKFEIGIVFNRNKIYKGGVYSVFFLYQNQIKLKNMTENEIGEILLKKINYFRGKKNLNILKSKHRLNLKAKIASKLYYQQGNKKYPGYTNKYIIYKTGDPMLIPGKIKRSTFFLTKKKQVGIGVYYPPSHAKKGDTYYITISF